MTYELRIHPSALRELERLPVRDRRRVDRKIRALAEDPRPAAAVRLRGTATPDLWRIRSGDYRIVYRIEDDRLVVLAIRVRHRREVYRNL